MKIVFNLRHLVAVVVVGGGGGVVVSSSADVEKDNALSEVVLNRPADGICVLVGEVDCYADFAKGAGGWRRCGRRIGIQMLHSKFVIPT